MALNLPRLPGGGQIVTQAGVPTGGFLRWWAALCAAIEAAINTIATQEAQIAAALGIAVGADAAAIAAAVAANGANTLAGGILADTSLNESYVSGITITAADAGSDVTITISSHTRTYGDGTSVSVDGGTVTGQAYSMTLFLYYDQSSREGGAVTYDASDNIATAGFNAVNVNRHMVGSVTTPAALAADTDGVGTFPAGVTLPSATGGGGGGTTVTITAGADLPAGSLVNLYNDAGVGKARLADGSTTGKQADGFVAATILTGATGNLSQTGQITGLSGLTVGSVWLSDTTPGGFTSTAPTTAGHTMQEVGFATSSTSVIYSRGEPVVL